MATTLDERQVSRRVYCGHCHKQIPKSSFYRHRNRYYDHVTGEWRETDSLNTTYLQEVTVDMELLRGVDSRSG